MKKTAYLAIAFLVSISSCQEIPEQEVKLNSIEDMNILTKEILNYTASNLSSYLEKGENEEFWFDQNKLVLENLENLDGNLWDLSKIDKKLLSVPFVKINLLEERRNSRISSDDYSTFNEAQLVFADNLITNLLAINDLSEVGGIVRNSQISVTNSSLSQEEKDELYLLGSSALSIANFLMNGGGEIINQELTNAFGDPTNPTIGGRIQGCSVNTRAMFTDTVVGLTVGAVGGAYSGATLGTIASPIGTITGAVSGAVVGGASGFITGALYSVVSQLWQTCWR